MKSFIELYEANFLKNLTSIVNIVYKKEIKKIEKRFDGGMATCTYASYVIGKELAAQAISFTVISGDFDDMGHWWVVAGSEYSGKYIVDIGNNIPEKAILSGKIEKSILPNPSSKYKQEYILSWEQYQQEYQSIKGH